MLYPDKVIQALESKKAQFHDAQYDSTQILKKIEEILQEVMSLSKAELDSILVDILWPGARPTQEQDTQPFIISFQEQWQNHQQARAWAKRILNGVATFCADGSQISLGRDVNVPVGMVQIGWFENHHVENETGEFIKDVSVTLLAPEDLSGEESGFADQEVEWQRFQGELAQAERFMQTHSGKPALAFIDGSLVVSFVSQLRPDRQISYVKAVEHLLSISRQTKVPLVGYIDTSYATDLVSMLAAVKQSSERMRISDAAVLRKHLENWGDRSRIYFCARDDRVLPVDGHKYYPEVCFTYLRTTLGNPPARLEFPTWILDSGRQDWILDVIRAECVVGNGYPYTIETADAVAVLSVQDREHFMAIFQQFMEREHIPLRFSRKVVSKRQRRV
jgi:hypothetical protein